MAGLKGSLGKGYAKSAAARVGVKGGAAKAGGAKAGAAAKTKAGVTKAEAAGAKDGAAGTGAAGIGGEARAGASGTALYACVHGLLHTMRLIERQEEHLCAMQDEMKRTGRVNAAMRRQLQTAVEELPVGEYAADVAALRRALLE